MKLTSLKQFEKKSRGSLMRFINGYLKTQSKKQIAIFAYTLAKSKLPRLRTIKRKALPYNGRIDKRRKKKRKFSRKQLAAQRLFAKRARAGTLRRR
jgi:hypothetical protein